MIYLPTDRKVDRRNAWPLTFCRRWELAQGLPLGEYPSQAFLRALKRFDSQLELYWHPRVGRWVLYRVVHRGGASSDDQLIKEFTIADESGGYRLPSWWLIDHLRALDKTKQGTIDPQQADRAFYQKLEHDSDEKANAIERERSEAAADAANELRTYSIKERRSLQVSRK